MSDAGASGPARRAVVRWALRLLRREWRQHLLVLTLLTVAVAAALLGATAAYHAAPTHDGEFGLAHLRYEISVDSPERFAQFVTEAESFFGEVDVITLRDVAVPGSTDDLEIRSQDPAGPFGAPMLTLRQGRFPSGGNEVALTDGAARLLGGAIGDEIELDGAPATVVGLVENPGRLDAEFALVAPAVDELAETATILIGADDDRPVVLHDSSAAPDQWSIEPRGQSERALAALGVLIVATVAMLLVALISAAAFLVVAQRRQRQLGLLAAAGGTERHVRMAMLADGAAVGLAAAVFGSAIALAAWMAAVPALERGFARRLDRFDIPWWVVAPALVLAVATAVAGAWWPARTIARLPIMSALAGRPAPPRTARRSAALAVVLLAGGVTSLALAIDPSNDTGNVPLALIGVVATTVGLILLAPIAVRLLAPLGRRAPLAMRVAMRDLVRYQSRSGAALAAVSLGLAIAVSVVVTAAANEDPAESGNLSERQVFVHVGGSGPDDRLYMPAVEGDVYAEMQRSVEAWAATVPGATIVPLEVAVDETLTLQVDERAQRPTVLLGIPINERTNRDVGLVFVATTELLSYLSIDPASIDGDTLVVTEQPGDVYLTGNLGDNAFRRNPVAAVQRREISPYSSVPHALITERGVAAGGWTRAPAGWLIESSRPITDDQLSNARQMAAAVGLTVEDRDDQASMAAIRSAATGIGVAVALAILAMTIGLIRAESAGDVRTLTAVGASSRTRRGIAAATAGSLAILAAVLAMATAYAALVAGYTPATDRLGNVPVANLAVIVVGFPLVAAAAAWLLAGRQPRHIARPLTE